MRRFLTIFLFVFLINTPLQAQVREPTPTIPFSPKQDFFVEVSVDNLKPFVGQQIVYTLRFYASLAVPGVEYFPPDFVGFWQGLKREPQSAAVQVGGRQYFTTSQDVVLVPTRAGSFFISPATVIIPATALRDRVTLTTETIALDVQPLPGNPPEGFNGAVGQFDMTLRFNQASARVGEPFMLQLIIEGLGDFDLLLAPDWAAPVGWRVYDKPPQITPAPRGVGIGSKVFEWMLIPDKAGLINIPAITFVYFDPQVKSYRTLVTRSFGVEVLPGKGGVQELSFAVETPTPTVREILPIKAVEGAIQYGSGSPNMGFWLLWLFPPLAAGVGWVWVYRQRRIQRQLQIIRQATALNRAQSRLRMQKADSAKQVCRAVSDIIYAYLTDRFGESMDGKNITDLRLALALRGIPIRPAEQVLSCLEGAEEGRYAPVSEDDVKPLVNRTLAALASLDKAWITGTE